MFSCIHAYAAICMSIPADLNLEERRLLHRGLSISSKLISSIYLSNQMGFYPYHMI